MVLGTIIPGGHAYTYLINKQRDIVQFWHSKSDHRHSIPQMSHESVNRPKVYRLIRSKANPHEIMVKSNDGFPKTHPDHFPLVNSRQCDNEVAALMAD